MHAIMSTSSMRGKSKESNFGRTGTTEVVAVRKQIQLALRPAASSSLLVMGLGLQPGLPGVQGDQQTGRGGGYSCRQPWNVSRTVLLSLAFAFSSWPHVRHFLELRAHSNIYRCSTVPAAVQLLFEILPDLGVDLRTRCEMRADRV